MDSERSQILFPVSSLKDEENGITKSATGNNKSKYISSKWEEQIIYVKRNSENPVTGAFDGSR